MIIITSNTSAVTVKIPNNLTKGAGTPTLTMFNTTNRKTYTVTFTDQSSTSLYYIFTHTFTNFPEGEYEYSIDGNKGLMRITTGMTKTEYSASISFKEYQA